MATSLMQKQKTGSWSAIFPTQQVTQQQSALFVKKLLAVAISNITYLRTIFPEHAFGDRCLEDLSLKILRDDSACPGACQVIQWVKGCFDALDRKYLRMITVGIFVDADDPMTAVETYSFKFDYNDQKGITIFRNDMQVTSAFSELETKRATIKLLRTIIVLTQTLQPLPDDVMMTMKLYYYDDVTPEDYEPPGFQPTNPQDFEFEDSAVNIKVGDVSTPFHSVKLRIKTNSSQFTPSNAQGQQLLQQLEGEGKQVGVVKEGGANRETQAMDTADTGQATGTAQEPTEHSNFIHCRNSADASTDLCPPQPIKVYTSEDNIVRCPCGVNEDDGLMVLCAVCQVWQHAVCFGFLEEESVPDQHVCILCAKQQGRPCTDPSLVSLNPSQLQSMCLWRRTLHACCDLSRLVTPGLARRLGVGQALAQTIMERLEQEGLLKVHVKGKRCGRVIVKDKLVNEGIPKYFKPHPPVEVKGQTPCLSVDSKAGTGVQQTHQDTRQDTHQDTHQDVHQDTHQDVPPTEPQAKNSLAKDQDHAGVQNLTDKAADLSISATEQTKMSKPLQQVKDEIEVRRSPRIRAKRVRSVMDESKEFELSCSQEADDQHTGGEGTEGHRRKRRKASIASNSIMV